MTINEKADSILKTEPNFHDVNPNIKTKILLKIAKIKLIRILKRGENKNG